MDAAIQYIARSVTIAYGHPSVLWVYRWNCPSESIVRAV